MKFPKNKAFKNEANLDHIRKQPCMACGQKGPSDPDHLRTRKSGGGDELFNLIPLCRRCHVTRHAIGIKTFVEERNLPVTFEFGYPRRTDVGAEE